MLGTFKIMDYKLTINEIPKLGNEVWESAECYKREGTVEEKRESDYVLVFYDDIWTPAKLQLIKRTGSPKHEYNWFILSAGSWYTDFADVRYWIHMLDTPER